VRAHEADALPIVGVVLQAEVHHHRLSAGAPSQSPWGLLLLLLHLPLLPPLQRPLRPLQTQALLLLREALPALLGAAAAAGGLLLLPGVHGALWARSLPLQGGPGPIVRTSPGLTFAAGRRSAPACRQVSYSLASERRTVRPAPPREPICLLLSISCNVQPGRAVQTPNPAGPRHKTGAPVPSKSARALQAAQQGKRCAILGQSCCTF
jgi:hypothetical protein